MSSHNNQIEITNQIEIANQIEYEIKPASKNINDSPD